MQIETTLEIGELQPSTTKCRIVVHIETAPIVLKPKLIATGRIRAGKTDDLKARIARETIAGSLCAWLTSINLQIGDERAPSTVYTSEDIACWTTNNTTCSGRGCSCG